MSTFIFQPTMIDFRGMFHRLAARPATQHTVSAWPDVSLAIHKTDTQWAVSEVSTGCCVVRGRIQSEALKALDKLVAVNPIDKLLASLEKYRVQCAGAVDFDSPEGKVKLSEIEAEKAKQQAEDDLKWAIREGYIYPARVESTRMENYLITLPKLKAGKVRSALMIMRRQDGIIATRCKHAERLADSGALVEDHFVVTDKAQGIGYGISGKHGLTKAVADYIKHLQSV